MEKITTYSLLGAVASVVAERGADFVYVAPGGEDVACRYVYDDQPSCLFGAAFHKLGVSMETLVDGDVGHWTVSEFLQDQGMDVDDAVAFQNAQSDQDSGYPYGDVLTILTDRLALSR